jgi:hypothetical protein
MSEGAKRAALAGTSKFGREMDSSWSVLRWLLVTATSWFLLKELAPLLRPLLLAVFLAYIIILVNDRRFVWQGQNCRWSSTNGR